MKYVPLQILKKLPLNIGIFRVKNNNTIILFLLDLRLSVAKAYEQSHVNFVMNIL